LIKAKKSEKVLNMLQPKYLSR